VIFENSLGKVTMSNFHHPRALININQKNADEGKNKNSKLLDHIHGLDEDEEKQKEKKNVCTILLEIEKVCTVGCTCCCF
jgi:hypothetical protein